MITTDIIFQLKKDVEIEAFNERFHTFSERAKPLYDIKYPEEETRDEYPQPGSEFSDEAELSEKTITEIYELEQKLFRTYLIGGLNEKESQDIFEKLQYDSKQEESAIIQYVQHSFVYEVNYNPGSSRNISGSTFISPGIENMKCPTAWTEALTRGKEKIVAVIDGGVDYKHKYIRNNMWQHCNEGKIVHGYNFIKKTWDPSDEKGHGTHCAGIIAAEQIDGISISVAPEAKIMALKIVGKREDGLGLKPNQTDTPLCAQAIWFAACYGARVLSNSWSLTDDGIGNGEDQALLEAIDCAYKKKCIIVFAAGNGGVNITDSFPAKYPQVIAVASTNEADFLLSDSNFIDGTMIAAQGKDVWSLNINTDGFVQDNGTSMAAPHVAGMAALLLGINDQFSTEEIRNFMIASGFNVHGYPQPGIGKRVNALCCVRQSQGKPSGNCLDLI